jgi:two-component system LytT family response regulator
MKTLIIDDEIKATETLSLIINQYFQEIDIIGVYHSAEEGRAFLKLNKIDLLLLDINMPKESGFDFLRSLSSIDFKIIFITAYDQFAINAFEFSAIDYILKPVNIKRLGDALKRVKELIPSSDMITERYNILLENSMTEKPDKLAVSTQNGIFYLKISDIIRIEADINYSRIIINNEKPVLVSKTLLDFENRLSNHGFFRCHRSHLINLKHVTGYSKKEEGLITMSNTEKIRISYKLKDEFIEIMKRLSL